MQNHEFACPPAIGLQTELTRCPLGLPLCILQDMLWAISPRCMTGLLHVLGSQLQKTFS